jgi:uncharacterized membrane-anchored protein YitT (DUF2179 family)
MVSQDLEQHGRESFRTSVAGGKTFDLASDRVGHAADTAACGSIYGLQGVGAVEQAPHGVLEDALALAVGSLLIALGLAILSAAGLVTGGMAGLALLVGHFLPMPPGLIFAVLNLPFLVLALRAMGSLFTLRTVSGSAAIAMLSIVLRQALDLHVVLPGFAALIAGSLLGMGTLAFVRHGTGVGGVGVVTVWLGRTRGWNIGRTQFLIDLVILAGAGFILSPIDLAWSALSAASMGLVTGVWLRPDRYAGFSKFSRSSRSG